MRSSTSMLPWPGGLDVPLGRRTWQPCQKSQKLSAFERRRRLIERLQDDLTPAERHALKDLL
jgi:hypothetical protein